MMHQPPSRRPFIPLASRPRGRGFTLVELLVVIGIIALLISMLLPMLGKAREQANATKCASNVKQLMTAIIMFAQDHNGHLPGNREDFNRPIDWQRCWLYGGNYFRDNGAFEKAPESGTLYKYAKKAELYRCPSIQGGYANVGSGVFTNSRFDMAMFMCWPGAKITKIKNLSYIDSPSKGKIWAPTPIICQEAPSNQNGDWKEGAHSESDRFADVHSKGSYYGSVDGSAQFIVMPKDTNSTRWKTRPPSGRADIEMGHDHTWGWFNGQ